MKEPIFWHERDLRARRSAPITRLLLTPLANIYAWAGADRIRKAQPFKADIPVICVGNLTVGGSGKTPVVAAIRDWFQTRGIRAASLSRGYKGEHKGPLKVDFTAHDAKLVGDEPLMLACSGEVWIGADREEAARAMTHDGVQLIIMDDGHQNPTLHKDLSVLVIDGGNPYGNGFVFPKGPLREPVERGLSRADGVIVMGKLAHDIEALKTFNKPVLQGHVRPRGAPPLGKLLAFAGIGRPQKFFDTLQEAGGDIAETVPFPDHYAFTKGDLSYLRALASEREATLITTEKDYVRLAADERDGVLAFPVTADLPQTDVDALLEPVLKLIS